MGFVERVVDFFTVFAGVEDLLALHKIEVVGDGGAGERKIGCDVACGKLLVSVGEEHDDLVSCRICDDAESIETESVAVFHI